MYIQDTLHCFISQTYSNIEIVVVNNGSTDDTLIKIHEIKDHRINLIEVKNVGASAARNIAYKNSKGQYIVFFDADDLVNQDYLFNQIQTLNGKTNSVVLAQWGRFKNNDLTTFQLISNPEYSMNLSTWVEEFWYNVNPMTNPGRILIPRNIIDKAGLWNEELSLNDDLEFFTRIIDNSESILFNDKSTLYYRSGINGLSEKRGKQAYTSLYKSFKLSTKIVLEKYNNNTTQKACANMWQNFIYIVYPHEKKLLKLAEIELRNLVKPNLKFPAGGLTKLLIKVLGWRLTVRLKTKIYNFKLKIYFL